MENQPSASTQLPQSWTDTEGSRPHHQNTCRNGGPSVYVRNSNEEFTFESWVGLTVVITLGGMLGCTSWLTSSA